MAEKPTIDALRIDEIEVSDEGDAIIALLTIHRPAKLNALNGEVSDAIKQAMAWAEADSRVRVVVIRGAAPSKPAEGERSKPAAFVAGADITEFVGRSSAYIRESFADNPWEAIWNMPKPTIAMVDGFALGGGCELALACDIRIASDRSRFGTPEIDLGLIPGGGGTQRLCHLVGYGKAMEMVMGGEMVDAAEAHRIGLVNHVTSVDLLEERTMALAKTLAAKSPLTILVAKRAVRDALDTSISDGILMEREAFADLFDSQDMQIGVDAFLKREKPEWTGR